MSGQDAEQEPSMEEILASIRRIISEDGDGEKSAEGASSLESEDREVAAEEEVGSPSAGVTLETKEDILELTDEIQDDGRVINLNTGEVVGRDSSADDIKVERDQINNDENASPETEAALEAKGEAIAAQHLISKLQGEQSVSSLSALAEVANTRRRASDASIGAKTIEELGKEVMRPMIREWLDENLPSLVERLVSREIERLAREAEEKTQR